MKNNGIIFYFLIFCLFSCGVKYDQVSYLNTVYEIDSIYRIKKDTTEAFRRYKNLFKKYPPNQTELTEEYETYIKISDKINNDFGGKNALYKLIPLVAPNWKYKKLDRNFITLYHKYGIDSIEIEREIIQWKQNLNKRLIDSFSIAFIRDQEKGRGDKNLRNLNDSKNEQLLLWTFKKYGFPSQQKIGLWGNNNIFMPMPQLFNHMADSNSYKYFEKKLKKCIRNGKCPPRVYADLADKYSGLQGEKCKYGSMCFSEIDTVIVNKNRKQIGLPSIEYEQLLLNKYR